MNKPKILVVDDQPANIFAMKTLLDEVDAEVITADSGNKGLMATIDHRFALILLDINMPGMDGFEMAEILRTDENCQDTPIIFVTAAYKDNVNKLKGYIAGAVDYIEKPIDQTILLSKVNIFLELHRSRAILANLVSDLNQQVSLTNESLNKEKLAREQTNNISIELTKTNKQLTKTVEQLSQSQVKLIEQEKMASLGQLVAGVAHEINTPIGIGVTASTTIVDKLKVLKNNFESKTLKSAQLAKFINESEQTFSIIYQNLARAADLISSFKQVAVDQTSEAERSFSFHQVMNEIITSLTPTLNKNSHKVNLVCDEQLTVHSRVGIINQVMINLIMNSIIHGFEKHDNGIIDIEITLQEPNIIKIKYQDDGKGCSTEVSEHIFEPFYTTKRGRGGSGLGMHLVYNIMTQLLNGEIKLSSREPNGVCFDLLFPVKVINSSNINE